MIFSKIVLLSVALGKNTQAPTELAALKLAGLAVIREKYFYGHKKIIKHFLRIMKKWNKITIPRLSDSSCLAANTTTPIFNGFAQCAEEAVNAIRVDCTTWFNTSIDLTTGKKRCSNILKRQNASLVKLVNKMIEKTDASSECRELTDHIESSLTYCSEDNNGLDDNESVVGGDTARPNSWPSLVKIIEHDNAYYGGAFEYMFCHGTIVSNHWVLGDSYCCYFSHQHRGIFGDGAFELPIETHVIHPDSYFHPNKWPDDTDSDRGTYHDQNFCLYKFSTDIMSLETNGNVQIACLPVVPPTVGNNCWLAGVQPKIITSMIVIMILMRIYNQQDLLFSTMNIVWQRPTCILLTQITSFVLVYLIEIMMEKLTAEKTEVENSYAANRISFILY